MALRQHDLPLKARTMPYMQMIRQLQTQLDRTSNKQRRQELETQIVILLGLVDMMERLDAITSQVTDYIRIKE